MIGRVYSVQVLEVKWNAVGRRTTDQAWRWEQYLARAEQTGRAQTVGHPTYIGSDWLVACDDKDHADWLMRWLIEACGFERTMLKLRRA